MNVESREHKYGYKFEGMSRNYEGVQYLRNARVKSFMDNLIPIDSMIPPSAGAYNSFDTLHGLKELFH